MFSFSNHTKDGVKSIILDIQSGIVHGAVIVNDDKGVTHILSVVTKSISSKTNIINSTHLTKKILNLVSEAITYLSLSIGEQKYISVHYILSSPWINTKLKTITIDYKKETEITSSILTKIINDELNQNNEKLVDMRPIEQKVFEIKLNGYSTASFENKMASKLEISLATSLGSNSFIDKLNSTVNSIINTRHNTYNSALLMQYTAFRSITNKREYIYMHIHSELTDIVIVKDGLCRQMSSFPFGISTFIRKIMNSTKQSMESSDSLISLFQGNKLDKDEKETVQKIIQPLLHEWSENCIKSFMSSFDVTNIPRIIYLAAHSHFDLLKDALMHQNDLNFSIMSHEDTFVTDKVIFDKTATQSSMIKMYTLAIRTMI